MLQPKKRILHFIESEGVYGAERVILNLSQQMQHSGEYTPIVGCIVAHSTSSNALYDAACQLNIEAVKIPIANSRLLIDLPKAAQQIKRINIDLIHSHGYKPSVFGFIIRLLSKTLMMATCHLWFEPSKGPLKMRTMIKLEKYVYRWFSKIIAVSEPIKAELLSNGIDINKVDLIRNGVDIPNLPLSSEALQTLRNQLGLTEHDFCVLNTARLTRQKAQWVLIKAAAIMKQQGEQIRILIVGEGVLAAELHALIIEENVSDCVSLLGFRADVTALLRMSNIFALPSIDEGMPMSLLEAAAMEKPIISTLVGDIGKLITDKVSGRVIPLEDPRALAAAILELKNNPQLAQQLAHNAHQKMQTDYSSQAMSQRYVKIYSSLLSNTR